MAAVSLDKVAKDKKLKYFLISFVDLFGVLRSKLVPVRAIKDMQKDGAGFAGFAAWLDLTPADADMFAVPDPDSLIILPWQRDVGWLASDLYIDGKELEASPRVALKQQLKKAAKMGYTFKTGVEGEYHLIKEDGSGIYDDRDIQDKPCYDQSALMRRYDVISEICDAMVELGWGAYQNDHEDANGQWEMNWEYDHVLKTCDRHTFFKYMVKQVAENHGMRATFMPKPFSNLTGNGCHINASLWDKTGKKNMFSDAKGELGLSKLAYHFLGGVIKNVDALTSIFNPTVNSYKRINAPRTLSGATWSPNTITWGGNNRTNMVRIPEGNRIEFRLADGAMNPYLAPAALLACGLQGVKDKVDPGKPCHLDMYTEGHKVKGAKKLPLNLLDALRLTDKSKFVRDAMGDELIDAYIKLRMSEWDRYCHHITQWERDNTLDC
ncbi:MAG: type III glutamate--ammonia ligase [Pseudomonadota bacterium]